jgi:hypothetical protein
MFLSVKNMLNGWKIQISTKTTIIYGNNQLYNIFGKNMFKANKNFQNFWSETYASSCEAYNIQPQTGPKRKTN